MPRTPEDARLIEDYRKSCGYVEPPRELWPAGHPEVDPSWDRLHAWFSDNTECANDAVLVFMCDRGSPSIGAAYIASDGWAKRRSQLDDNGEYISYN